MSKILNIVETLKGNIEEHPSLKSIAVAMGVAPQRIYSVAKQPVEGREYNAKEYNWEAIDRFVERRLEGKFDSLDDMILKAYEIDADMKTADGRLRHTNAGANGPKPNDIVMADGTVMPARKATAEMGQRVMLKSDRLPHVYQVVLITPTHVCLQREGTTVLSTYSNWTWNQKAITDETQFDKLVADREAKIATAAPVATPGEAEEAE